VNDIPLSTLLMALVGLLLLSGFFSIAETAMMAVNRHRLRLRAQRGARGAKVALDLLARTDTLLGVILLGNTLVNAIATTLTAVITARLFGQGEVPLMIGGVIVALAILIFSEITPKVVGAAYADRVAPLVSYALSPLLKLSYPVVWFVNLFVQALLKMLRLQPPAEPEGTLSQEELRSLVLEGHYFRGKHRAVLANIFDLDSISVDAIMTPRNQIEALDLSSKQTLIEQQLATTHHTRLPVYEGTPENVIGLIHVKQVLRLQQIDELDAEHLREVLRPPYFIPAGTPLLAQLQQFQTDRQRLGLVVDEYGELLGLVTLEDILEEIVGDFTTQAPGGSDIFRREDDGSVVVDGMAPLRVLNRKLGTEFPLDGPKTLSGLIVEHLGDIPDAGISFVLSGQPIEVMQVQDRAVKVVKLVPPVGRDSAPALQTIGEQASSIS
jgi:Mg2+/Co2+ transporter CorB